MKVISLLCYCVFLYFINNYCFSDVESIQATNRIMVNYDNLVYELKDEIEEFLESLNSLEFSMIKLEYICLDFKLTNQHTPVVNYPTSLCSLFREENLCNFKELSKNCFTFKEDLPVVKNNSENFYNQKQRNILPKFSNNISNDSQNNRYLCLNVPLECYGTKIEYLLKYDSNYLILGYLNFDKYNFCNLKDHDFLEEHSLILKNYYRNFEEEFADLELSKMLNSLNIFNKESNILSLIKRNYFEEDIYINKAFKINICEIISDLENRFAIRIFKIIRLFIKTESCHLNFILSNTDIEKKMIIIRIYKKFLTSQFTLDYLSRLNLNFDKEDDLEKTNYILVCAFKKYKDEFFEKISDFYEVNYKYYFCRNKNFFADSNGLNNSKKLKVWFYDLFNNKTNITILMVIPELVTVFNLFNKFGNIRPIYRKIHCIYSLVVFRYSFLLPFLKLEFSQNINNSTFNILNSKILNCFILEVRLMFYYFILDFKFMISLAFYIKFKAFSNFTILVNPDFHSYFVINEFVSLENINEFVQYLKLGEIILFRNCEEKNKLKRFDNLNEIIGFDSRIFNKDYKSFSEVWKNSFLFFLSNEKNDNEVSFINRNSNLVTKITKNLKNQFK